MQMQVIVSACFSLYTYESNLSAPQPAISLTQQNSHFSRNKQPHQPQSEPSSITTNNLFSHNKQLLQLQPKAFFIIRAMPFRSTIAHIALKRSSTGQHPQRYLFAHRRKIKGQKQDLSSHSHPSYFIISPKRVLLRYAFLII